MSGLREMPPPPHSTGCLRLRELPPLPLGMSSPNVAISYEILLSWWVVEGMSVSLSSYNTGVFLGLGQKVV